MFVKQYCHLSHEGSALKLIYIIRILGNNTQEGSGKGCAYITKDLRRYWLRPHTMLHYGQLAQSMRNHRLFKLFLPTGRAWMDFCGIHTYNRLSESILPYLLILIYFLPLKYY
jgi:hypothetical protein